MLVFCLLGLNAVRVGVDVWHTTSFTNNTDRETPSLGDYLKSKPLSYCTELWAAGADDRRRDASNDRARRAAAGGHRSTAGHPRPYRACCTAPRGRCVDAVLWWILLHT